MHSLSNDFSSIKPRICGLDANNCTPLTMALDLANRSILVSPQAQNVIGLLLDGAPDNSSSVKAAADAVKFQDIRIITIGVSGADEHFLKAITSSPDDNHFCNQTFELESTYVNIATQLYAGRSLKIFLMDKEPIVYGPEGDQEFRAGNAAGAGDSVRAVRAHDGDNTAGAQPACGS